jgi:hypothetical protein
LQHGVNDEWYAQYGRYQPVRERRKVSPKWEVLAIINIEGD